MYMLSYEQIFPKIVAVTHRHNIAFAAIILITSKTVS